MLKATFLGHSAVRLETKDTTILIDPFFTDNPQAVVGPDDVSADFIVVTHGHGDHVGDTVAIAQRTGATCISTYELATWLGSQGCQVHPMGVGGSQSFPFGRLKFTIAHHSAGAGELGDRYVGTAAGVVIDTAGHTVHHAGDTALTYDMKLLAESFNIDLAFLPIGDNFTMGVDDAVRAVEFIQPKQVVPIHYNTWAYIEADADGFAERVNQTGTSQATVLQPMESITL